MRGKNNYVLLSTDVDPQEEDTEKSSDFDDISEFHFYFSLLRLTVLMFALLIRVCD